MIIVIIFKKYFTAQFWGNYEQGVNPMPQTYCTRSVTIINCKTGRTCTQKWMLYANHLVKIFFSNAANLWSFCICFTLKRTWCKCNQHIKVHLSLEDREQEGSLSHLSLCHLAGDLGAINSCEVPCLDIIIIPSFCLPIANIPHLSQGTQGKSAGLKHLAAGVLARWLWRRRWQEVVETGTWIHTGLTSTKGTNASCFVEMVKSKGKIFSLREEMGGGALGDLE